MANDDLTRLSITEAAAMVRDRRISPVELTEAALAQAERLQPSINSWITLMGDQALAQAREQEAALARGEAPGLLSGIPVGIKDNIEVGGVRATVGTKVLTGQRLRRRRPRRHPLQAGRCHHPRQGKPRGVRRRRHLQQPPLRRCPQSLESRPHTRRLQWRWRCQRGRRSHLRLPRHRPRRLGPPPRHLLRRRRPQADLRPGQPARSHGHQLQRRPHRPHDPHRRRRRPHAPSHRRLRPP